ncbi:MAG: pirin [Pseudonocardiales bacterium]|nr:pirin [Pseudonocardiales bacterium]
MHPGGNRFETVQPGIITRHCFSSGAHYDPDNTSFGALVTCDEHFVEPGAGFARHRHAGLVIVSWVLEGTLRHEDADGGVTLVRPGSAQVFSTAAGVEHGEFADGSTPTRFVQMAVLADPRGQAGYQLDRVTDGPLAVAASVNTSGGSATLSVVRLSGAPIELPAHPRRFVFVTRGALRIASVDLRTGDSVRTTAAGPLGVSGPARSSVESSLVEGEALIWDLPA